jgi:predicted enzyme related to lactoylglutathione lyase
MKLLVKEPFVRTFVSRANAENVLAHLKATFNAGIDFQFDHEPSGSTVYSVTSDIGRFSVTATDKEQPDFIAETRAVYIVESIDDVLKAARKNGIEIAQEKAPVPIGFQARLRLSKGNVMELAEWTKEHIDHVKANGFKFHL